MLSNYSSIDAMD